MEHKPNTKPNIPKIGIPEMLKRLDNMYNKEEELKREMVRLQIEWKQLQDDKEMLQNMIMYQSNKINRVRRYK